MTWQINDIDLLDIFRSEISGIEVLQTVGTTCSAPYCAVKTIAFTNTTS